MATTIDAEIDARAHELLTEQLAAINRRGNRLFLYLMLIQWAASIIAAQWISPLSWAGAQSSIHAHVWAALLLGGAITSFPVALIVRRPDAISTRHIVAVSQMLWSALFIHLTSGRIETHFHVFGSLALLACYRDARVLLTATLVVAVDHFVRGLYWSESVYGILAASPWRSVEHAGWVLFENLFLWISIRQSIREMKELAIQHARLEKSHEQARAEVQAQLGQLQRAEERLHQSQKMEAIGQLAGGVAHDFNNLLTIMAGYCEIILGTSRPGMPHYEEVMQVKGAADRAAALTRQLLAFSRKQILAPKLLNLNDIVRDMDKMLRRLIGEDIALTTILDPNLARISADPGQLEQVIMNLVVNARDAMAGGGKLTIETRNVEAPSQLSRGEINLAEPEMESYVQLAITDTGCGMDAAIKDHIFEPFFTTKELGKGTGLGLATVYGIVKQSGGNISVYSEPGHGTTFKIYVPRVPECAAAKSEVIKDRPAMGTETILLVEDETQLRCMARRVLESHGYNVIEAENGLDAIGTAVQYTGYINLLLTDVVMPQIGGRQLAQELKTLRPQLKVIYMSGYTDDAVIRHCILAAETHFVQKPFSPAALLQRIREVLDDGVLVPAQHDRR